jgi:hypothetical protein
MSKPSEKLTAREFVWEHRLRQRIILERIVSTVGNPEEQSRAKQFLEAMENANPELLENIEQLTLDLFGDVEHRTPELFDDSEYSKAKGLKTALKLPRDIAWEERIIRRAVRDYRELFNPCEVSFNNAMKGLRYLKNLLPELFARAREQAVEQRAQILTFEIYCKCDCTPIADRQPADSFKATNRGRFRNVSKRITSARQTLESTDDSRQGDWQFFLDRVGEVAPEMLES